MGMDHDRVILLALFSLVLLTAGNITDIGVLRLYDQFDILGGRKLLTHFFRFFGVVIAWWLAAPFAVYIAILAVAYIAENLYLSWCGRREYRRRVVPHQPVRITAMPAWMSLSGSVIFLG